MPWKSLFKGLDSSPTTPKIMTVSLPSFDDTPTPTPTKTRARTPSILKGAHVTPAPATVKLPPSRPTPAFQTPVRPITPAFNRTRAHSLSSTTTASTSSSEGSTFFRVEPPTPHMRSKTPHPPRPPNRITSPMPTMVVTPPTPKPFPVVEEDEVIKPPKTKPRSASYPATAYVKPTPPPPQPQSPPQQVQQQAQPDLHWQLLPYERGRGKPFLHFDIQFPLDCIRLFGSTLRPLGQDDRRKPAANAPLTKMTIRCGQLPMWEIDVRPRRDGGTLTCADVFDAIYETYHVPVTEAEKARLPAEFLEGCDPYFRARCKLSARSTESEERRGLRRVDLLRGRTIFRGLTCPTPGKGYWVIHLDRPRSV